MKKQTLKQRKAIRSAAAKKGWETRRDRKVKAWTEDLNRRFLEHPAISGIPDILRGAPPKPSLWQRIKGWVLRAA